MELTNKKKHPFFFLFPLRDCHGFEKSNIINSHGFKIGNKNE